MTHTLFGSARNARGVSPPTVFSILAALCVLLPAASEAANIVGYYDRIVPFGGYAVLAAQFQSGTNGLDEIVSGAAHGTQVWLWNTASQSYDSSPSTFNTNTRAWTPPVQIPPGKGFLLRTPPQPGGTNVTLRFTGFVLTGQLTNSIAGSNKFSLVGAMVAQDGTLGGVHQFPGDDGELVYQWDMTAQRYKDASTYFAGHGWHGGGGIEGPLLVMGEGFFVQKHGPDTNWVRTLQAEKPASLVQSSLTTPPSACDIRRFNFQDASVVLEIVNPGGVAYDVQFSRDRSSWSTISARRTGIEWKGPAPGGTYGFYRVIEAVNQ